MRTKLLLESLKGRCHPKDLGEDGRVILKLNLRKCSGSLLTGFIWHRRGTVADSWELSDSIIGGEFLD
jgi:hypothetical protein